MQKILILYVGELWRHIKGLEAEGNTGMLFLTGLSTKWIQNREFSQSRSDIRTQFRHECCEYHRNDQNLHNMFKKIGLGSGVWGSGVRKKQTNLRNTTRHTMIPVFDNAQWPTFHNAQWLLFCTVLIETDVEHSKHFFIVHDEKTMWNIANLFIYM